MTKQIGRLAWVLFCIASAVALAGCAAPVPPVGERSPEIRADGLRQHVQHLSKLGGRATNTGASKDARKYLISRMNAYGLQPWGAARSFEQPFVIGTNVVGVIPGSDPRLADEYVLVSAHYDHLGKVNGLVHPGACDNASGDAALLEIAEMLTSPGHRPKRPVICAFFDAEEMGCLGSLAFTARPDVAGARIVAAVNADMLGRQTFDLAGDRLIIGCTEQFPGLRSLAACACADQRLAMVPLGRDLVGPRSDHVSLEGIGVPAVFLSSGPNRDYHKPTDTADQIDYALFERQARAEAQIVAGLANADVLPTNRVAPAVGDRDELRALVALIDDVLKDPKTAGVSEGDVPAVRSVAEEGRRQLARGDAYTVTDRAKLVGMAQDKLLPAMVGMSISPHQRFMLLMMNQLYARHVEAFTRVTRAAIAEVVRRDPDLFHPFGSFATNCLAVDENSVRVATGAGDQVRVSVCAPRVALNMTFDRLGHGGVNVFAQSLVDDAAGTRDEMADFALLRWMRDPDFGAVWAAVLKQLTGADHGDDLRAWQTAIWRLPDGASIADWVRQRVWSDNPAVAGAAIRVAARDPALQQMLVGIMRSDSVDSRLRMRAVWVVPKDAGQEFLSALVDLLYGF